MTDDAPDLLRLLVDAETEYAIIALDPDGRVAAWNPGAARILGYVRSEVLGQPAAVFHVEEDRAAELPRRLLDTALREGRTEYEGWQVRKDGSRLWASVVVTALHDATGRHVGFGEVARDLTSRRLSEEQLRATSRELADANEELEQFRLLVASVRDYAIFVLDAGGHVRTWNAGAEAIKGYTEAEIVGRHFSTFYTQPDRDRRHPQHELEIAAREGRFEEEGWRVRSTGETFWATVVITALRDARGTLVGFAKVTRDLTERREAQLRLRATADELERSNAELERFASAAAHDLVEPLQTMAGFAELVERRYGERLDDDGREFLGHITDGARRMRNLIDGLLRYARAAQREVQLEPVDVAATVDTVVRNLQAALDTSGAEIDYDAAELPCVLADEDLLVNVLQNLVANAIKFSGERAPRVSVSAERQHGDGDGDGGAPAWRITVADNGLGIAPADQERIFRMFGRAHTGGAEPGVGIGLALCERLVQRLGGAIGVDSEPGAGSRFWFTLQDAGEARPAPAGRARRAPSADVRWLR